MILLLDTFEGFVPINKHLKVIFMMSLRLSYFWLAEPRKVNITALFISGEHYSGKWFHLN